MVTKLRATYASGRVIEKSCCGSYGLRLPYPDRRPVLIELSREATDDQVYHAQVTVDIQVGKVGYL